ncbi:helix-turn-helix domain-containing protein [Cytobacillus kochii]|uniref:helix-turn-helix domain-containing protein n=1 Tax=Cytobacillus kochii TaxID=859143 RepID=UPI00203B6CDA|nr:helix-turn-helix transcriptional regulator [Cytobacillus kochii]MCM3324501.1 helix-turn-helix domain-containing protein [Cytobacillus kochii]MCM3346894.1 helix-turn-helix domain-containing protein [Cytobacillus kochii]
MNHIDENIRLVREQHGLTRLELAKRARVGSAVIERYESGISTPDTLTILKLCTILDIPVSTITNPQVDLQNQNEFNHPMLHQQDINETISNSYV